MSKVFTIDPIPQDLPKGWFYVYDEQKGLKYAYWTGQDWIVPGGFLDNISGLIAIHPREIKVEKLREALHKCAAFATEIYGYNGTEDAETGKAIYQVAEEALNLT